MNFTEYVAALDSFLQMDKKLVLNFKWEKYYVDLNNTDAYQFDEFYDVMKSWAISDDNLTLHYEDFAVLDEEASKSNKLADFRKMADRVV